MYGVSKITTDADVMLVGYSEVPTSFVAKTLTALAKAGVVIDMITQTAPVGRKIHFGFTAPAAYVDTVLKAQNVEHLDGEPAPKISGGYTKINLFGAEMVESVGVAARAFAALEAEKIQIDMVTTSDLDISLLIRREDEDVAEEILRKVFEI